MSTTSGGVPYVTDNPYRAVGLGSAASLEEVRTALKRLEREHSLGIKRVYPLHKLFGVASLEEVNVAFHKMLADSRELECYRFAWPANLPEDLDLGSLSADGLISICAVEGCGFSDPSVAKQWRMLGLLGKLSIGEGDVILSASDLVSELSCSDGFRSDLVADKVYRAWLMWVSLILLNAYRQSKRTFRAVGRFFSTCQKVEIGSRLGDDYLKPWIEHLKKTGEDIHKQREEVEALVKRGISVTELERVVKRVGDACRQQMMMTHGLKPVVGYVGVYEDEASKEATSLSIAIRNQAVDIANNVRNYGMAERLLKIAASLPVTAEWRERLEKDMRDLDEVKSHAVSGISPVRALLLVWNSCFSILVMIGLVFGLISVFWDSCSSKRDKPFGVYDETSGGSSGSPPTLNQPSVGGSPSMGKSESGSNGSIYSAPVEEKSKKIAELQGRILSLRFSIFMLKGEINQDEEWFEKERSRLESLRNSLFAQDAIDRFNRDVDTYNKRLEMYKKKIHKHDQLVEEHNRLLYELRSLGGEEGE